MFLSIFPTIAAVALLSSYPLQRLCRKYHLLKMARQGPENIFLLYLVHHYYANHMTEGGKDVIRKTEDHNWDMKRMQFEKERANVSDEKDYVNAKK
jgi:hypothetical protein